MRKVLSMVASVVVLAGCASIAEEIGMTSRDKLPYLSAGIIDDNTPPAEIQIENAAWHPLSTEWVAVTRSGRHDCWSTDTGENGVCTLVASN